MNDKQKKDTIKKTNPSPSPNPSPNPDIVILIERKMTFFQDTIQRTILHVQTNKMLNVIGVSEMNNCINALFDLSKTIKDITEQQIITAY